MAETEIESRAPLAGSQALLPRRPAPSAVHQRPCPAPDSRPRPRLILQLFLSRCIQLSASTLDTLRTYEGSIVNSFKNVDTLLEIVHRSVLFRAYTCSPQSRT